MSSNTMARRWAWLGFFSICFCMWYYRESPDISPSPRRLRSQPKIARDQQVAHIVDSHLADEDVEEETVILNLIWANEQKWQILKECLEQYEAALDRLYPRPVKDLKVPRK